MKYVKTLFAASAALMSSVLPGETVWPEAIADSLSSDGSGYVDLGYRYHVSSFPKTARMVCELYDNSWGKGRAPGPVINDSFPRTVFGYQESSDSVSVARYNGGKANFVHKDGQVSYECGRLETVVTIDYINQWAKWKFTENPNTTREFDDVPAPASDSGRSYYLFANNEDSYLWQGIFAFKNLRVYELTEAGDEVLARDYVPCVDKGQYGVYDKVTCGIFPVQNDTNCFSAANVRWRLTVEDEVDFVTGAQTFTAPESSDADGWMLVMDSDGTICASGDGTSASFTMPEAAVTLRWVRDEEVGAAAVRSISEPSFAGTLTLAADSVLAFAPGGVLTVSRGVVIPESGTVNVSCPEFSAAGTYTLIRGNTASLALSSFAVSALPDGLTGSFERRGDAICLRVTGVSSVLAALPDKIVESLTSDGAGYVDLGYRYRVSSYPKTARIECDFYDTYWGSTRAGYATAHNPRGVFGYEEQAASRSMARWSGGNGEIINSGNPVSGYIGRFNSTVVIDYVDELASWEYEENGTDLYFTGVGAPVQDASRSYYLFALNSYRENYLKQGIFKFRNLRIYEQSDADTEVLARNFVPAVKNGRPCVFDRITGAVADVVNDTNGFVTAGASWPSGVYSVVTQEFACAVTRSFRPVATPGFAPGVSFTFVADGSLELGRDATSATVVSYAADGSVASSETIADPKAGRVIEAEVGTAAKTVVTLSGMAVPEGLTVFQDFGTASVQSADGALFRKTGKHECEFMLPSAATLTFNVAADRVFADEYDGNGELIASERIHGHVDAGEQVAVAAGDGAYRILRVQLSYPRFRFIVR